MSDIRNKPRIDLLVEERFDEFNDLVRQGKAPDLRNANLSGLDLRKALLKGLDLSALISGARTFPAWI